MRHALIATALLLASTVAACGTDSDSGPERRTAAGQVLGGEVSDAMIPLDTVRSTAPVAARSSVPDDSAEPASVDPVRERRAVLPQPEVSGGPELLPSDPSAEDGPSPPQP